MIWNNYFKNRIIAIFSVITMMIFMSTTANTDVIHVDPNGNDNTGNGSSTNPYWSIERAEEHPVHPGDTILVHTGTYANDPDYTWVLEDLVGAPNQWITIMGEPGEQKPVLDRIGLLICAGFGHEIDTLSYLRIKDIIFRNTWMHCINIAYVWNSCLRRN